MSLNYDNSKQKETESNNWASMSDLFMVMSFVFLLLYVISSLRNGTYSVQQHVEYQKIVHENQDLKKQLGVYDTRGKNFLEKKATHEEKKVYKELMGKLDLLKETQEVSRTKLQQKIQESLEKENALNKYQQIIRNIINANMVAKGRIAKQSDALIKNKEQMLKKNQLIEVKLMQVEQLQETVEQKAAVIEQNNNKITDINESLSRKIAQLKKEQKKHRSSKSTLKREINLLKKQTANEIAALEKNNEVVLSQLEGAEKELESTAGKLSKKEAQVAKLNTDIAQEREKFQGELTKLEEDHENKVAQQKQEYEGMLASKDLSIEEKEAAKEQFKRTLASLKGDFQNQSSALSSALQDLEGKKPEGERLTKALAKANEKLQAKEKIVNIIKDNFKKAGIDVNLNPDTGDVELSFGKEYFDTGKFKLKKGMIGKLKEFVPIYAKSLLENKEVANKIKNVEIIGFASPTYKGKYVDPKSLSLKDKEAVDYNMNLSFFRAKEIFRHIFDKKRMKYTYQKELFQMSKVSGRSFLADGIKGRNLASGITRRKYCKKYNCKKSQKVIMRFNLK